MARRIRYTGAPVLTTAQVAEQCRLDEEDLQADLVEQVIIPGVTAQAEAMTGAAIRAAEYEEEWPEDYASGHSLDVGQASGVISVRAYAPDGTLTYVDATARLERGQRESFLHFPQGRPKGRLLIRYRAGVELDCYPAVLSWLLMQAGTAYSMRESLVMGKTLAELPRTFMDSLLAEIQVPPRF